LANDLQGYSNIDAENSPFALSVAGFTWCMNEHHSLFAGIRRVDEDYFCSDALSLFTNSSCGNFPTLSSNHDLATYPLAAMSIHYAYDNERFGAKASLYNGTGHQRFAGCENVFRICPHSDGISALGQIEYRHHGSQYFVGASLHEGKMEGENTQREICSTTWVHAEQALSPNLTLLASYAHVFSNEHPCRNFCGVGGRYVYKNTDWGIYSDYTRMDKVDEWATELTCNLICNANLSVQPVLHIITTDKHTKCVGMLRLNIGL
jgi:porin